jgi:ketosteroid isomerase-like protein
MRTYTRPPTERKATPVLEGRSLAHWSTDRRAPTRDTARAMSQENVEVVRRHVEAWNRRDMAMLSAVWHSDAEIDWSRARGPLKGIYRGRGEREAFWNDFYATFEEARIEAQDFAAAGSEVVVSLTARFRGREGIEVTARSANVYTVENGQITRLRMFQERAEALEAAGLSE